MRRANNFGHICTAVNFVMQSIATNGRGCQREANCRAEGANCGGDSSGPAARDLLASKGGQRIGAGGTARRRKHGDRGGQNK